MSVAGSHHNADAATSNYSVTIPTPGVVLDTDDPEPYQVHNLTSHCNLYTFLVHFVYVITFTQMLADGSN